MSSDGILSRVVDQCVVDPSSVPIIDRISQKTNIALLETGLKDLMEALERNDATVTQETKEKEGEVLTRLGELLGCNGVDDGIKLKVAKILRLSCVSDCDPLFKWNLSKLLISQLDENSNSVDTKVEILLVLSLAAQKSKETRDTLVNQGIIESVTTFVKECKRQYALKVAASLIKYILSIKDLDSEKTHSLVPVLSKLLKFHEEQGGEELALRGLDPESRMAAIFRSIYREKQDSFEKIGLALDAVVNLLTEQTCMEGFDDREQRSELVTRLARTLNFPSFKRRSLGSLEKLYGFTQDGPQETGLKPRLTRIREATRDDIEWYELQEESITHPIPRR